MPLIMITDKPMPCLKEVDLEKPLYYKISKVSKLIRESKSCIRYWYKFFEMRTKTTKKGDRLFTIHDIQKLGEISNLVRVEGHTLKGAKQKLKP